jgi:transcriptional regulator with XRE-family HTH domain
MPALLANSDADGVSIPSKSQTVTFTSSPVYHKLCEANSGKMSHTVTMADGDKNGGPNNLEAWRRHFGLSREELAARVGTAPNQILYLENGERGLSLKWLRRLAPALGINVGWLAEHNPDDIHPDLIEIWRTATDGQRRQISKIAQTILMDGTNG